MATFFSLILFILTILLIGIIMLQRGRGGGLAGALGGMGGQSAFGTRAGDVFTRITAYMALVWVALACLTGWLMRGESERFRNRPDEPGAAVAPSGDDKSKADSRSDEPANGDKSSEAAAEKKSESVKEPGNDGQSADEAAAPATKSESKTAPPNSDGKEQQPE
jgi:preprotein translocase subunit SecG